MDNDKSSSGPRGTEAAQLVAGVIGDAAGPESRAGVNEIRDLLFGNQMQDYDHRFANKSGSSSG